MDFLSVLLRLLVRAGKERRASRERERDRGRSCVVSIAILVPAACHSRYSRGLFCVGG